MEQENNKTISFDYNRVGLGKLTAAFLADVFILIILTILLILPGIYILNSTSTYKENTSKRNTILVDSKLYVNNDNSIISLTSYLASNNDLTYNQKNDIFNENIKYFFTSFINTELENKGLEKYYSLLEKGEENGNKLFSSSGERLLTSSDYDKTYYDFYIKLYNTSLNYLQYNTTYKSTRNLTIIMFTSLMVSSYSLSYLIVFLVIPLIIKRGKKTLGRLLTNISLLGVNGFSCSWKRYVLRFLFSYIFMGLGIFLFLVPNLVSLGFTFFTKTRQSLTDYLFTTYKVNSTNKEVYLNLKEYEKTIKKNENIKDYVEDKINLDLSNPK